MDQAQIEMQDTTSSTRGSKGSKGSSKNLPAPPRLSAFTSAAAAPITVKKALVIYNPVGGKRRGQKIVDKVVLPLLREAGIEATPHPTLRAGHGAELARTLDLEGVDALLAVGGDGTLSEVLSGFLARETAATTALGFVPGGTGNTFMHDALGIKPRGNAALRAAVEAVVGGLTRRVDAARLSCTALDGKSPKTCYSLNIVTAGLGVDANAAAEKRRWMGPLRYDVSILEQILRVKRKKPPVPVTLSVDGRAIELDMMLVAVMNNKRTGVGLRLAPYAQLDDGKLDVVYNKNRICRKGQAFAIDGALKKFGKHVHNPDIGLATAGEVIELTAPTPQRLMADGDLVGYTPLRMDVLKGAFSLFTVADPPPL